MSALGHLSQKQVRGDPRAKESFEDVKQFCDTEKQVLTMPYLQGP